MIKVTPEQANKEYMEWTVIRNKEGYFEDLILEFCAEILETNHYFYERASAKEAILFDLMSISGYIVEMIEAIREMTSALLKRDPDAQ